MNINSTEFHFQPLATPDLPTPGLPALDLQTLDLSTLDLEALELSRRDSKFERYRVNKMNQKTGKQIEQNRCRFRNGVYLDRMERNCRVFFRDGFCEYGD